jgi:hypothetical protein
MTSSSHKTVSPAQRARAGLLGATLFLGSLLSGCAQLTWRQQLQSENPLRRIDGAIAAARAQDRAALPLLVDRLQDDDVAVRMYAIMALEKIEGTSLGYKFWAADVDRARMAHRWRNYLRDKHQGADAPLAQRTQSPADLEPGDPASPATQPHKTGGPR